MKNSDEKSTENTDYIADSRREVDAESGGYAILTIYLLLAVIVAGLVWAYFAKVDEVTQCEGKIVPSEHMQVIQNLEGGIISEILVQQGQPVKKGEVVIKFDDIRFKSQHNENLAKKAALEAEVVRLSAEANAAKEIRFDEDFKKNYPNIVIQAERTFQANKTALDASLEILNKTYTLAKREYDIVLPLTKQGVMSEVDRVRLERQLNDAKGAMMEKVDKVRTDAQQQLTKIKADLAVLDEELMGTKDRIDRAIVRSPVDGVVNQLYVTTVGAVLQPGQKIMDIVPLGDKLMVQAFIKPADIGFIHINQEALVKVSAYDSSIYGGLKAKVKSISADVIVDEHGNSFYDVDLETEKNFLKDKHGKILPIIPGMTVTASILTGYKTILDYIMKPLLKAREGALTER